jgi:beta-lactamase superfamily II metal-dependent hydrolase
MLYIICIFEKCLILKELALKISMTIKFLSAYYGDSILISFNYKEDMTHILIDGGTAFTYESIDKRTKQKRTGDLKKVIQEISNNSQKIDLLIVTHVDCDHIDGILNWFEDEKFDANLIKKIWFNSGNVISDFFNQPVIDENFIPISPRTNTNTQTGIPQGVKFENIISKAGWEKKIIKSGDIVDFLGLEIKILSPDTKNLKKLLVKWEFEKENNQTSGKSTDYNKTLTQLIESDEFTPDKSIHNGSSIAFLLTWCEKNFLFLGDAFDETITESLEKLGYTPENKCLVEIVKLSHHGSKANTSSKLLELIDCDTYAISTNGERHGLPDKTCLSRIIKLNNNPTLLFNYPELISEIFNDTDYKEHKFIAKSVSSIEYDNNGQQYIK